MTGGWITIVATAIRFTCLRPLANVTPWPTATPLPWVPRLRLRQPSGSVKLWVPAKPGTPPSAPIDGLEGILPAPGVQLITLSLASVTLTTPDGVSELPSATSFRITMAWIGGLTLRATLSAFMLRTKRQAPARVTA